MIVKKAWGSPGLVCCSESSQATLVSPLDSKKG